MFPTFHRHSNKITVKNNIIKHYMLPRPQPNYRYNVLEDFVAFSLERFASRFYCSLLFFFWLFCHSFRYTTICFIAVCRVTVSRAIFISMMAVFHRQSLSHDAMCAFDKLRQLTRYLCDASFFSFSLFHVRLI